MSVLPILREPNFVSLPAKETRLVVFGDSDFATAGSFDLGINGDVFLNSVTWLGSEAKNTAFSMVNIWALGQLGILQQS